MLTFLTNNGFFQVLLRQDFLMASKQAGALIGPIANFLGKLYNAIFEMVYSGTKVGTLGIAIIVFTIVVKMILMPLMYNQQKAAYKLRKVKGGEKVATPNRELSKKPLTHREAVMQLRAVLLKTKGK